MKNLQYNLYKVDMLYTNNLRFWLFPTKVKGDFFLNVIN